MRVVAGRLVAHDFVPSIHFGPDGLLIIPWQMTERRNGHSALPTQGRLVEQHLVPPQRAHGFGELLKVHRFDDVAVDAQIITLHNVALLARCGEDHHRHTIGLSLAV